ncbi:MAG: LysE family translocator [Burkholderiaceae bacterium]
MTLSLWFVYLIAAVGLSLTPGPNGLLSITHSLRFGAWRTIWTALGGVSGFMVLVAASLAGLGALLAASEQAFTIAKWVGAGYLVYLGVRTWRAPSPVIRADEPLVDVGRWYQLYGEGFLVAVSNPKALIFFAAFLPQFMTPALNFWMQLLVLGGTFAVVEFVYEISLAGLAQRIAPWFGRNRRWFNKAAGAMFVGIAGLIASAQRLQR